MSANSAAFLVKDKAEDHTCVPARREGRDLILKHSGIETSAFFIVGYPGEANRSVEQTRSLATSLPLTEISINVPFPLPGSPLFSRVGSVNFDADWLVANEITFTYKSEFDEGWLGEKISEARQRFTRRKTA